MLSVIAVEGSSAFLQTRPGGSLAGLDGEILSGFARLQDLELELVLVESWSDLVPALEAGRGLRVATVPGTSLAEQVSVLGVPEERVLARRDDPDMRLGLAIGDPQSLALGVRREDPGLRAALDEYLLNLRRGGSWNRLVVGYFGDAALEILRETRDPATN